MQLVGACPCVPGLPPTAPAQGKQPLSQDLQEAQSAPTWKPSERLAGRRLLSSSYRDYTLSAFQHYFETGKAEYSSKAGDVYEQNLRRLILELDQLPHTTYFVWKE